MLRPVILPHMLSMARTLTRTSGGPMNFPSKQFLHDLFPGVIILDALFCSLQGPGAQVYSKAYSGELRHALPVAPAQAWVWAGARLGLGWLRLTLRLASLRLWAWISRWLSVGFWLRLDSGLILVWLDLASV